MIISHTVTLQNLTHLTPATVQMLPCRPELESDVEYQPKLKPSQIVITLVKSITGQGIFTGMILRASVKRQQESSLTTAVNVPTRGYMYRD